MPYLLLCLAILTALPRAGLQAPPSETVIPLTVQPMAAPRPALRYLLLPDLAELNPGNPIPNYLKCLMDAQALPDQEDFGSAALRQADWAARLDKPDWQILLRAKTDGASLLLPDVQKMRAMATALQRRFRTEAGLGHFDDALRTAKTMFAMSRHMGEHPTLIGDLVAVAMAMVAIAPLEEMLQQPGCPNLYWALTNLPSPLISIEKGLEGERLLIQADLRGLDDQAPMSPEQLKKLIDHLKYLFAFGDKNRGETLRQWLDARIKNEGSLNAARRRLVEAGLPEGQVKQFPPDQVILLDEKREYEERRDELVKTMNLPTWQVELLYHQTKPAKEPALFDFLVPALIKVRRAQGRLEQRIALLRHVEALRLYAAEHDGRLPEHLADVAVPLPVNPFSNKPFLYRLDGATAHLRGSPPPGEEQNPAYNLHYEIMIQKGLLGRREFSPMIRFLLAAAAIAVVVPSLHAEEPTVRLNVRPMPAPKPALKYQLLPEVRELNPGNPAQWYLRCFAEQRNFFYNKEAVAERARYLTMPLAELPAEKLLDYGGSALTQADWAARLDAIDWQALQHVQNDGLDIALPEVEPLRILGTALRVRFRAQVASRHFDEALVTAKTMFGLSRHLGEHPTEAANQVGMAIAILALDALEEMIQQPGCPNLYWALTDLPSPLVNLRKGAQGERSRVAAELRLLLEDTPMTDGQVEKLVSRLSGVLGYEREQRGQPPRNIRVALAARFNDPERVRSARGRLVESGYSADLLTRFPPVQVILLDEKRDYEIRRDESMKLLALAAWRIDALGGGKDPGQGDGLFADLRPYTLDARRALGRLEQRVALLRNVEGLRMYAADHNGRLPEKLTDVAVPLAADPITGEPFVYQLDGETAHFRGKVRYDVTLQK